MGETRVDLQHLLEDLRDAYTGSLEETILTEVVANALDSGATLIRFVTDAVGGTLTIVDNGRGMQRRDLARYHDIASSTKTRGEGIGFAGVGIKLGLLVSREVITETRRGAAAVATRWHLASQHRAPWKWMPSPGLTNVRGTAVRLVLANQLSPLLDAGFVEETIRRHFEPLLDGSFDDLLWRHYPKGVRFDVDGRTLIASRPPEVERVPVAIRLGRRRTPSVVGFIERHAFASTEPEGIAVSTFGKIIKRGWEWLGLTPAAPGRIAGVIEAPDLAACLTLSKNDFVRTGTRGATYLAYRKAIQEVVSRQLAEWGDRREGEARPRMARLERDLERVLEDLADNFPLLRSLVDRRSGGQKRLPMPGRGDERVPPPLFADIEAAPDGGLTDSEPSSVATPSQPRRSEGDRDTPPDAMKPSEPGEETAHAHAAVSGTLGEVAGRRRPARYGLLVQFESRPGDTELARLVDSTIWINDAHPAYVRASASRSLGYHSALAVALALAPLAVGASEEHGFVTQFLAQWGSTDVPARTPGRRRARGVDRPR